MVVALALVAFLVLLVFVATLTTRREARRGYGGSRLGNAEQRVNAQAHAASHVTDQNLSLP